MAGPDGSFEDRRCFSTGFVSRRRRARWSSEEPHRETARCVKIAMKLGTPRLGWTGGELVGGLLACLVGWLVGLRSFEFGSCEACECSHLNKRDPVPTQHWDHGHAQK